MKDIYQRSLDKWGEDLQIDMMIEECAELIQALSKYKRAMNQGHCITETIYGPIYNELADVQIMLRQMYNVFGRAMVDHMIKQKLERLEERLKT